MTFYNLSPLAACNHSYFSLLLLVASLVAGTMAQLVDDFSCPDDLEGFYPHLYSCDKYWHCSQGLADLRTCGNGLGFIDTDPTFTLEQCAELHLVECGERTELEPPISTPNCPRLYGTFADELDCGVFWKCQDGKANRYNCPPGLAYDQVTRGCKWADQVPECSSPVVQIDDEGGEFQCPSGGSAGAFTKHPHPADCRQYFLCINGQPREYGCPLGEVFNAGTGNGIDGKCTGPEEVPECRDYYGDEELPAVKKTIERSRSSGDRVRNTNTIPRAPAKVQPEPVREVVREKARPAPPALQAIVDGGSRASPPRFSPGRGRPARPQARPEPVEEIPATLPPRLSIVTTKRPPRIQILTDKPTTQFENPTTRFTTASRPEATFNTFGTTVARFQPTEAPTQPPPPPPTPSPSPAIPSAPELIDLPDDSGLPPPAKAAPG